MFCGRVRVRQVFRYRVEYPFEIVHHIAVPKAQDAKALQVEPCGSRLVARAFEMLAAVHLYHQAMLQAAEVRDVAAERELAAEFRIQQASVSQAPPEFTFRFGLLAPKAAGILLPLIGLPPLVDLCRTLTRRRSGADLSRLRERCTHSSARAYHPAASRLLMQQNTFRTEAFLNLAGCGTSFCSLLALLLRLRSGHGYLPLVPLFFPV